MDNATLDALLAHPTDKQFWLKPIGWPRDHPLWDADERGTWTERQIEIHFAKNPVKVAVGAVLIAYRIRLAKIIYVAERLPRSEWDKEEPRSADSKKRWPHYIKARNLTPEFGKVWKQFSFEPFSMAKEYTTLHSTEPFAWAAFFGEMTKLRYHADLPSNSFGLFEILRSDGDARERH